MVQVNGQPTWRSEQREGGGEELLIDRTNKIFRANGSAWLRMPGQSVGASGFLPGNRSAATNSPATNRVVEIRSDQYEFRTNFGIFQKDVRLTERSGEEPQGRMTCGQMIVTFAGTNELQRMLAENDVAIEQKEVRFTAAKADYSATHGLLELTGKPACEAGPRQGTGDIILLRAQQGLEYEEIAAALATTPGAARVNYHHAVRRLKEVVK